MAQSQPAIKRSKKKWEKQNDFQILFDCGRGEAEDIKAKIEQKTVAEQQEQWHSLEVRPGHFNTWAFVKKSQTNDLGL